MLIPNPQFLDTTVGKRGIFHRNAEGNVEIKEDVYSMDTWDHLKHLKSIVEAHTKAGIKIQPKKTKIFQTETEYLGHRVSQGGVQMLDQNVKDIQSWPRPTNCKEMSSFLGFTGY